MIVGEVTLQGILGDSSICHCYLQFTFDLSLDHVL